VGQDGILRRIGNPPVRGVDYRAVEVGLWGLRREAD
jgi:hypothetical protein